LPKRELNDKTAFSILKSTVEIDSPSGQEEQVARYLADTMSELGFKVKIDEAGNVHGTIGSGKPTTLFCGHMDTVPGSIPVREQDGYLHGRGSVDAKGSLIAMIVAAARHGMNGEPGRVLVVGVVEEERRGEGVKALINQRLQVDYAVFGEPSGAKRITIGYKGSIHLRVEVTTESGHSSAPWAFPNAIVKAFSLWTMISEYLTRRIQSKSHYRELTGCITGLKGGSEMSITPGSCEMNIDIRIPTGLTVDEVLSELREEVKVFRSRNQDTKIDLYIDDRVEPFETSIRSPVVQALNGAIKDVYREPAKYIRKTGTGDMNILGHELGIPVVTYGPGDSRLDHSPHEKIEIDEFLGAAQVCQRALVRIHKIYHDQKGTKKPKKHQSD
jgi:LysW-gamma-L-lysine carboxypeptidase